MNDAFYPELDPWPLQVIAQQLEENPLYLEDPECPYPEEVKSLFQIRGKVSEDLADIDLEHETLALYQDIKTSRDNFQDDDHAERNSYFRVATSLLEKLLNMRERANNIRQVSRFYEAVLQALERYLEPDQITEFRDTLKEMTK